MSATEYLKHRAESYWRDADVLAADDPAMAVAYRTISEELRRCAAHLTCACPCHEVIQPGLIPCSRCEGKACL